MNDTIETLVRIAAEAAVEIMKVYEEPFSVDYKGPNDPVTAADRRANGLICERLAKAFPGVPVVAEESPAEQWEHYREHDEVFFVDPIDGTREFVARNGNFVVMIGLLEGDRPTHGVLHAPEKRTVWAGCVGEGAFKIEPGGQKIPLPPLTGRSLSEARIVSSTSQRTALNEEALRLLAPKEIVPLGSAGLKGAAVADGTADIYMAPRFAGCLWDTCAPEALVRSVGGAFTDVLGRPLDYRATAVENNDGAVAAHPEVHAQVVETLSQLFR